MVLLTITTLADTITSEQSPSTNYTSRPTTMVRNTSGRRMFGYIQARGLPNREGGIVNSAVLRQYPSRSRGSVSYTIRRASGPWTPSSLRWNNQPAGGTVVATPSAALTVGQPFDVDVTSALTAWLTSGQANYGFRLETSSTVVDGSSFHSVNASGTNARFRPVLLLDVSYPPETPTALAPADGASVSTTDPLATWRYGGEAVEPMVAYQLQTSLSDGGWSTPLSDTGEVTSTVPQHQFSGVSGTIFWRVRHKSTDGRWSPWSSAVSFTVTAKMTITITSTETVTDDPTPTTTWTVSGGTQVAFQVLLLREDNGAILAESKVTPGADGQWAPDRPLNVGPSVGIMREVRGFDAVDRVATPGDPIYAVAMAGPFTIEPASSVDPVTDLAVATPLGPAVDVSWSRTVTPDSFIVERRIGDGPWVRFQVESGDVALGGGAFRWRDVTAPANRDLTYRVRPVHNGAMGEAPDEVSTRLRPDLIWLADPDDPDWLLPVAGNDAISWEYAEQSSVLEVASGGGRILVHEGLGGAGGTVTGLGIGGISHADDMSVEEIEARFWDLKRKPGHIWRLVVQARNIPVWVRGAQLGPRAGAEESYGVAFEFGQWGENPWEDGAA